jgi:MFS family permease
METATASKDRSLRAFTPALILLFVYMLINYLDRGNVSTAGPLLKKEFGLSASQLGILFATFFSSYTAMQFVVGWLVDRFDESRILAAGFVIWSLATAATGIVRGFAMLLAMRLVLGVGESVALPACTKILARHLPEHWRGFASGALMTALRCGNAIGTLAAGLLMARFGWRPIFMWVGIGSLLWLPAWSKWKPRYERNITASVGGTGPRGMQILSQRSFWGGCVGHFASNYLFYFMITWLPSYLVLERHLSMTTMAGIAGLYYSVDAAGALASGWLQDHFIRSGYTPTVVRKAAMAIGFAMAALALMGCALASSSSFLLWLLAAGVGCGTTGPGLLTFPQTLAGPRAAGRWYGWQNGFANFSGVVGPALTGFVVQETGKFLMPFVITAAICIAGIFAWVLIVGRVEQVNFSLSRETTVVSAARAEV